MSFELGSILKMVIGANVYVSAAMVAVCTCKQVHSYAARFHIFWSKPWKKKKKKNLLRVKHIFLRKLPILVSLNTQQPYNEPFQVALAF